MFGFENADQISESVLDQVSVSLTNGLFPSFEEAFLIPQRMITPFGPRDLRRVGELRALFLGIRGQMRYLDVSLFDQRCIEAEYRTVSEIAAVCEARLVCGRGQLQPPFQTKIVLRHRDGLWKIAFSDYSGWPKSGLPAELSESRGAQTVADKPPLN